MSTKHTPGIWYLSGEHTKYVEALLDNGFTQEVASVGPTLADGGYGEQQQANARLIAAAPELLEALICLRGACAADGWLLDPKHIEHMNDARAAISKATGEQA